MDMAILRLSLYLSLVLLMSCANTGGQFSESTDFHTNTDNALIIIGLSNPKAPLHSRNPKINLRKYEPDTNYVHSKLISVFVPTGITTVGTDFKKEDAKTFYIFEIEPGHYFIESLYYHYFSEYRKKAPDQLNLRSTKNLITTLLYQNAPTFHAEAGEATYLGEFEYFNDLKKGIEINHVGFNKDKLRDILRQYKGIKTEINKMAPGSLDFNCPKELIDGMYQCNSTRLKLYPKIDYWKFKSTYYVSKDRI
jgi:hypothetical protein